MAAIAGLKDLRKQGPPGDIGTFVQPATALVFQFTFSGTTTIVAMAVGVSGWVLIDQGAVVATVINAALTAAGGADDGEVVVLEGTYTVLATLSVPESVLFRGVGWATIFNYDAAGNCITITGDNVKVRDLKVLITAGAGDVGARPNGIYATGRTNLEITKVWIVGDLTVADEAVWNMQNGILVVGLMNSKIAVSMIEDHYQSGFQTNASDYNVIIGNTFQNTYSGVSLYNSTYNAVVGNTCIDNLLGIYADNVNNSVDGNTCQGGAVGIYLYFTADYNDVFGNFCTGYSDAGIYLYIADANTITGNTCINGLADWGTGIWVEEGTDNTVTGNICQGNYAEGIYLTSYSSATVVAGNTCQGNTNDGIYVGSSYTTVTGNTCQENGDNGITVGSVVNCSVVGNTCSDNVEDGISLTGTDATTVTGNSCKRNIMHGIVLSVADGNIISGNTCDENDYLNTGTYDGISIGSSDGNLVLGNQCRANDRWGIYLTSSDYNKVSNNYTEGNTAGSITVFNAACDNTQVEWNTVEEGAPVDAGTLTRSYGNYDPSANAFVGNVGAPPF